MGRDLVTHLNALPVHGPDGRIRVVREALGMKQSELADVIRAAGGRASRETVSHWENLDANGQPRSRCTRRNAGVIAQLVRERLGVDVSEQLFFEPEETAWDGLERRQLEMSRQLERLLEVVQGLQSGLEELRRDRTDS